MELYKNVCLGEGLCSLSASCLEIAFTQSLASFQLLIEARFLPWKKDLPPISQIFSLLSLDFKLGISKLWLSDLSKKQEEKNLKIGF